MTSRLEIADHPHAVEAAVQQQQAAADADRGRLAEQALEDLLQRFAAGDGRQGDGEAGAAVDDIQRGVGMEVAGPALGRRAIDLVGVVQRLAVIGDQDQVGGQALRSAAQGPGQVAGQGGVEPALQLGEVGQGGDQGQPGGFVGRCVAQALAGIRERGEARGGVEQQGEQRPGAALGSVVGELEVVLKDRGGAAVDLPGGEGRILRAHGSLL